VVRAAWGSWQRFLELGGTLDATASRQLLEVAFWLGIQAYDAGWTEPARAYLETVVELDPDNLGAHDRLARLALEPRRARRGRSHLDRLDDTLVADLPALRERADLQARHGPAAADGFLAGRAAQDAGDQLTALDRYTEATAASDGFVEAWRGRAARPPALGRPADAATAWQRVLQLSPGDATAAANLARARDQLAFGVDAQRAFERGVAAYGAGDVAGARVQFQTAVAQNPDYVDAIAWLGRIAAEAGDLATAATATAAPSRWPRTAPTWPRPWRRWRRGRRRRPTQRRPPPKPPPRRRGRRRPSPRPQPAPRQRRPPNLRRRNPTARARGPRTRTAGAGTRARTARAGTRTRATAALAGAPGHHGRRLPVGRRRGHERRAPSGHGGRHRRLHLPRHAAPRARPRRLRRRDAARAPAGERQAVRRPRPLPALPGARGHRRDARVHRPRAAGGRVERQQRRHGAAARHAGERRRHRLVATASPR
jgi:tetratricopeptide (TPR) repeat protein